MKIKLIRQITGTRNGDEWPPPGGELTVPDEEGVSLCDAGIAVPLVDDKPETATAPAAETRTRKRRSTTPAS